MRAPLRVILLQQQVTDEQASQAINVTGYTHFTFYLQGEGTISAGAVTYEESTDDPETGQIYSGTWSSLAPATNAAEVTGGAQKATHVIEYTFHRLRARISAAITGGGSITVILVATD